MSDYEKLINLYDELSAILYTGDLEKRRQDLTALIIKLGLIAFSDIDQNYPDRSGPKPWRLKDSGEISHNP